MKTVLPCVWVRLEFGLGQITSGKKGFRTPPFPKQFGLGLKGTLVLVQADRAAHRYGQPLVSVRNEPLVLPTPTGTKGVAADSSMHEGL
jgi:hypothetical protein